MMMTELACKAFVVKMCAAVLASLSVESLYAKVNIINRSENL